MNKGEIYQSTVKDKTLRRKLKVDEFIKEVKKKQPKKTGKK